MTSAPRRQLKPRQVETVQKLLDGGLRQLEEGGAEALTIRQVALQAGVSPATAYTYFSSKGHLVTELFVRMLAEDAHEPSGRTPTARVQSVTRHLTDLLEGAPALAAAVTVALLGSDPDVDRLRLHVGAEFVSRFEEALGDAATPAVLEALTFAFSGALLQAGMGLVTYAELGDRLDVVVATILEGTLTP
ncbi:TetR/AcrR family transcriptional regulator [Nocardioides panacisoli]|uniref:TetR/AcrR family transcriptional regulator n=1 Tax=Nocardioides panacisoli TaxID=627624 RepID=UPI001C63B48E|nr:TetR/AcrR family transcriptional regulator [Nocardioides panacisoli]QYJ03889.1 TetR/AcrR family transcriptional regulator [Nocardioides panacisoli]